MINAAASPPSTPQISIIIPVYNTENYLEECLQSVLSKTIPPFEIILVNDQSPDNSQAIIDNYVHRFPNITSCVQRHGGPGKARNTGLDKAKANTSSFLTQMTFLSRKP